jgi:hypothetical protein
LPNLQNMKQKTIVLAALLLAAPIIGASAQSRSFAGCWLRPAPAPTCGGYIVTEAAVEVPVFTTSHNISAGTKEKDFDTRFVLSVGYMHNLAGGRAAGVIVGHDLNRSINRIPTRAEARLRQWQGSSGAFDVSAGVSRKGFQDAGDVTGFTAAIGGEWRYIGADARFETYNAAGRRVNGGLVSARATSVAAPIASLVVFGAIAALIISSGAGY